MVCTDGAGGPTGRAGASLLIGGYHPTRLGLGGDSPPLLQRLSSGLLRRLPGPERKGLARLLRERVGASLVLGRA